MSPGFCAPELVRYFFPAIMVVAALPLLGLVLFAPIALASYAKNLNYHSPSLNHPELGLAVRKIYARSSPPDLVNAFPADKVCFTHGVASGDPTASAVILWTRLSPEVGNSDSNVTVSGTAPMYDRENDRYVAVSKAPVCVEYRVSEKNDMKMAVDKGEVWTSSDVDWTVKVDATGLKPFTYYYYQFASCRGKKKSEIGRTKTLPRPTDKNVSEIKLAVFSCANYRMSAFPVNSNYSNRRQLLVSSTPTVLAPKKTMSITLSTSEVHHTQSLIWFSE